MLVAPLCNPQPGQRVLDVCAAPGGKTTHLAHLMRDVGLLLACDVSPGRLRMLRHHIARFHLSSIMTVAIDATHTLPVQVKFDRILVDAPCSGLGVLRHHPDIKWRKSPDDFATLQATQLRLLDSQHSLLTSDGSMIYSVCSYEPEETHQVVAQFLAAHPDMQLDAVGTDLPSPLIQHLQTAGVLELTPEQWHTDGVFVARFRRKPSLP
jgi:16S rRNA (cytosine967-C5)-methyltransferase